MSVMDLIKAKREQMAQQKAASIKTLKPAAGKHTYRILPSWRKMTKPEGKDHDQFWHDIGVHYIRTSTTQNAPIEAAYICVNKTFQRSCDICEQIRRGLKACSSDEEIELLKGANSTQKYLFNVLHRSDATGKAEEVQVLEVGVKVFEQILEIMEEWGDITDLNNGRDIIISREGSGLTTKYTVQPASKSAPVNPSVMNQLIDLDAVVAQEDEAKKQAALTNLAKIWGILPPASGAAIAQTSPKNVLADLSEAEDVPFEAVGESNELDDDELNDLLRELG